MLDEETIGKIMRALSVAFPIVFCLLLLALVSATNNVATELKAAAELSAKNQPVLPAGIYICDGERCVIANTQNIDGVGESK